MAAQMSLEEFAHRYEWMDFVRVSQFVAEDVTLKSAIKKIREFKRGRPAFDGPFGCNSAWAAEVRCQYEHFLAAGIEPPSAETK